MQTNTVTSYTLTGPTGTDAVPVKVSCTVDPTARAAFKVTGVSEVSAKEIQVRVRAALLASDLCTWPLGSVVVTVESPNGKPIASILDLPIALAIATAPTFPDALALDLSGFLVAGELGLDGTVRQVRGAFQGALLANALGLHALVPTGNGHEAQATDASVHMVSHLGFVRASIDHVVDKQFSRAKERRAPAGDFSDVRGQSDALAMVEDAACKYVEIAAPTILLLSGAPGTGKTMIARRIPTILPTTTHDERVRVTRVYSALGLLAGTGTGLVTERPFRAPHHTISTAALVGGGTGPRPGELQLATCGVLFLDELAEFSIVTLQALGATWRAMHYSVRPMIVASANPCPCGWATTGTGAPSARECTCPASSVERYRDRIEKAVDALSGGVGIKVTAHVVSLLALRTAASGPASEVIAARVQAQVAMRSGKEA